MSEYLDQFWNFRLVYPFWAPGFVKSGIPATFPQENTGLQDYRTKMPNIQDSSRFSPLNTGIYRYLWMMTARSAVAKQLAVPGTAVIPLTPLTLYKRLEMANYGT